MVQGGAIAVAPHDSRVYPAPPFAPASGNTRRARGSHGGAGLDFAALRYDLSACGRPICRHPAPMNAPLPLNEIAAAAEAAGAAPRLREIPYNYTSFSDRE